MDFGSISAYVILGVIIGGFVLVTIMMQLVGKGFAWHEELE
jgi:hypothetical protein